MVTKPRATNRAGIIERVTTPLGFFTLGILVIEGILASLSVRATGSDLTVLILGMLVGFALLCVMVFVLAIFPQSRSALLGVVDYSPSAAIAKMNLTGNDIRVIYQAEVGNHGFLIEQPASAFLIESTLVWNDRVKKLRKLGLETQDPNRPALTAEGSSLAGLIQRFSRALIDLEKSGRRFPFMNTA
jgi:hypothetical protein